MIFIPAIDVRAGRAVRLLRGDFQQETVYHADPLEAARSFVEAGARFLHIVDLDGARAGEPRNLEQLRRIATHVDVPIQFGGGLRSEAAIEAALAAGATRVVLGTSALRNPDFLRRALDRWDPRVVVAVDVRGGRVSVAGWEEQTELDPVEAIARLQDLGAMRFVYTNADRDGTLEGPDLQEVERVARAIRGRFLYSGGIGSIEHLEALRDLRLVNLVGVICGKALYESRFTVAEAQAALEERRPRRFRLAHFPGTGAA